MATIDLGKIKLVWRGTYAGGTAYTVDDVVQHTDGGVTSSFICTTNSTGNAPSTGGSVHGSWAYLAKGHADTVSTTLTTQGDILYRDGSGLQRLAKGTAGQALKINSGATAPEWGSIVTKFVKATEVIFNTRVATSSQSSDQTLCDNLGSIVKDNDNSTSDLYVHITMPTRNHSNDNSHYDFILKKSGGSDYTNSTGLVYASNTSSLSTIQAGSFKFTGLPAGTYSVKIVLTSNGHANNGGHVVNPTASDNNRLNSTQTHMLFYEILQ